MKFIFILGFRSIPLLALLFYIQYLLSKKREKLLGLIIPGVILICSIILCISTLYVGKERYTIITSDNKKYQYQNKQEYEQKKTSLQNQNLPMTIKHDFYPYKSSSIILSFIKINIITLLLILIYIITRFKNIQNKRMLIYDL